LDSASWVCAGFSGVADGVASADWAVSVGFGMYGADSFLEYSSDSESSFGPKKKFLSCSVVGVSGIRPVASDWTKTVGVDRTGSPIAFERCSWSTFCRA